MEWTENLVVQEEQKAGFFTTHKSMIYGVLIGLGVGIAANTFQYFKNKKDRQALLDDLVWTINAFESALANQLSMPNKKGEIVDISKFRVSRTTELIAVINEQLYKNKLKGDERLKWVNALGRLVKLAQKIQFNEVARHEGN